MTMAKTRKHRKGSQTMGASAVWGGGFCSSDTYRVIPVQTQFTIAYTHVYTDLPWSYPFQFWFSNKTSYLLATSKQSSTNGQQHRNGLGWVLELLFRCFKHLF